MQRASQLVFKPFRLDPANACLWRGAQRLPLTPKAFMVLQYLVTHHGQLATKDALLEAVWPETIVGDAVLKVYIHEIRQKLGDTAKTPRYIDTVYRQGYRFIRRVATVAAAPIPHVLDDPPYGLPATHTSPAPSPSYQPPPLVGREGALAYLHGRLEHARAGKRQLLFVTGEAGIGKTALMEVFAAQVATESRVRIVRVQCHEQYGPGEAYLPILEALGRLCRAPGGERLTALLQSQAPTWLRQMPWLPGARDYDVLQPGLRHAAQERMLREIAEVIEILAAETLLVVLLEDLHWSDYATLDLISFLARRHESAHLLMIGSYRPVEVIVHDHPLKKVKHALEMQRRCSELSLALLREHEVTAYMAKRFQGGQLPALLVQLIYQRTDGNPLFLVNMVDYLLDQCLLDLHNGHWTLQTQINALEMGIPESLREMIEQQLERLTRDEQRVLEAASVSGMQFSAAAVAAGLKQDLIQVEERCDALARRQHFLRAEGITAWPDGTLAAGYGFLHWLYQHVAYHRMGVTLRGHLQQEIDRRLARAYSQPAPDTSVTTGLYVSRATQAGLATTIPRGDACQEPHHRPNRLCPDSLDRQFDRAARS